MAIIDFESKVGWHDLPADDVHSLAHMENDARDRAHDLTYGITGPGLDGFERVELAQKGLNEHNDYAQQYLGQLASIRGLEAETSTQMIEITPEQEVRAKLPILFEPEYKYMNWAKRLRIASGPRAENGRQLMLREVSERIDFSTSHLSRIENDERKAGEDIVDSILAFYSALNGLEGASKAYLYHMHKKQLGKLALTKIRELQNIEEAAA